jgi:predicted membrane protein
MFAQRISTYFKPITNLLSSRSESLFYVLMGLGVLFLVSAVAYNHNKPDMYVCLSGLVSLTFLMAAFVVAIRDLGDEAP